MPSGLVPLEIDTDPLPARRLAIVLLVVSSLIAGVATQVYPALATLSIGFLPIITVVTTALVYWWYWADSKLTGYQRSAGLNAAVLAFSLLGVLYYVARSRRGLDRLRVALLVVGVAVLSLAINQLGGLAAFAAVRAQTMKPESADAIENVSGDGTTRTCETAQFDEELQPIYRPPPSYPLVAQFYGIEGFIELAIEVGPEGRIASHEVINAEPGGLFEGAAVEALEQWKYCPLGDGETESRETKIRLRFDLEN